jgi:hypothetical protein
LSLVLLTVAGQLMQSLRNLQGQQFGFERQGRLLVQFSPRSAGYTQDRLTGLYQQMEDRFSICQASSMRAWPSTRPSRETIGEKAST